MSRWLVVSSQNRSVLEFIRETITAHRQGISTPSLIPTAIYSEDREMRSLPQILKEKMSLSL